jgi:hypothetical protein
MNGARRQPSGLEREAHGVVPAIIGTEKHWRLINLAKPDSLDWRWPASACEAIKMALENGTHAIFGSEIAKLLRILTKIKSWRREWDSNPR